MKHEYPLRGYVYWYVRPNNAESRTNTEPNSKNSSVQSLNRPWLIISNNVGNKYSPTVIGVPYTTSSSKKALPTHIDVTTKGQHDTILIEQVRCLDKKDLLLSPLSKLDEQTMTKVDKGIKIALGLIPKEEW